MKIGLSLLGIGFILLLYGFISYHRAANNLASLKEEDLVSYYLDLAIKLLPLPFWSFVSGALITIVALIILLISIPLVF